MKGLCGGKMEFAVLKCEECKWLFQVDMRYEGVVTCPYCGALVED